MTGDIAKLWDGYYRILGRSSVDIIKSGGYKISALEIEEAVRQHEDISDCAVVGIPDDEWGEIICSAYVSKDNLDPENLSVFLRNKLASYKLPRRFLRIESLPRNAMGKVVKPNIMKLF